MLNEDMWVQCNVRLRKYVQVRVTVQDYCWCFFSLCRLTPDLHKKRSPQIPQAYGRSSSFLRWLFSCSFKYFISLVEKSHFLQSYQVDLCTSTCNESSPFLLNQRPHLGYIHLKVGFSLCTKLCASSSLLKKQWKLHLSHWYFRS